MKIKNGTQAVMSFFAVLISMCYAVSAFSQPQPACCGDLLKRANSSVNSRELFVDFQSCQAEYLKDGRYSNFVDFLKGLGQKKKGLEPLINYFTGLTRYLQMRFLEEKQAWDEYFSQGNNYRDEISASLDKAVKSTDANEALNIHARLILWRFHYDQQDVFAEQSLTDLFNSAIEYAKTGQDLSVVKKTADTLISYGERSKAAQLYKLYINTVIAAGTKADDIKALALGFLNEGNIELAQTAFDSYIKKVIETFTAEEKAAALREVALLFAWKEPEAKDGLYAEKIFKAMEEGCGKDAFDEELLYLRAYNLERVKEYSSAKDVYIELLTRFPQTQYAQTCAYKIGLIALYIDRDESTARQYFEKGVQGDPSGSSGLFSLYQLGVLTQWEDELTRAQGYYDKLIENAQGSGFSDIVALTKDRQAEINSEKPLDNNIKIMLDLALKPDNSNLDMSKVQTKVSPSVSGIDGEFTITSSATSPQSGCMQVALDYIWAGDLGKITPSADSSALTVAYSDPGTKIVGLVVMCPYGVLDRSIDIIDVE